MALIGQAVSEMIEYYGNIHVKYESFWSSSFREEDFFYVFPLSMGANDPRVGAIFDPRGMVGRIDKEDHYTLLHSKYESSGPCVFGEYVLCFSREDPGAGPVWTPGARLAGSTVHFYIQNIKALGFVVSVKKIFFFFFFFH